MNIMTVGIINILISFKKKSKAPAADVSMAKLIKQF